MKSLNFVIIFLTFISASCSLPKWQKNDQPRIRIVDLQGKTHPISTKIPELNAQALASQGKAGENQMILSEKKPTQIGEVKYQNYQEQNLANAQATSTFPQVKQNPQTEQSATKDEMLGVSPKEEGQVVEYDLDESKIAEKPTKDAKKYVYKKGGSKNIFTNSSESLTGKFFVQVGSFSSQANADSVLGKMKKFHSGKIEMVEGEKTIYRVLLGPLANKTKAKELVKKITNSGHEAIITKAN